MNLPNEPVLLPKGERILTKDEARELLTMPEFPVPYNFLLFGSGAPLHLVTVGISQWNASICLDCHSGFFEYVYGTWWQCRDCGSWCEIPPRKED